METIKLQKLSKQYGKSRGISDVDLSVSEGEIYGFIGPNGAGKSTTIKLLLNFIYPSGGSASILGMDVVRESKNIKLQTGYVPSEFSFYPELKVSAMLKYAQSFYRNVDADYIDELSSRFELDLHKRFGDLSYGNKKKAALVQAMIHRPRVLILDEPTNGLDPLMQQRLQETLFALKENGTTVFLSSHNLNEVQDWCDRVSIIRDGIIVDSMEIDKSKMRNIHTVEVSAEQLTEANILALGGIRPVKTNGTFVFDYEKDIDALIKTLSAYTVQELFIRPKRLSELFMSYYTQEESK